jgi:hypothetical protein
MGCLTGISISSSAQSSRPPTPQEKEAIDRAVHAVLPVMQKFMDANWKIVSGGADNPNDYSVADHPDVPLNTAPFNDWEFSVKENSPLWNGQIQPMFEKLMKPPADYNDTAAMAAYLKLSAKYKNLKDIFIEVELNRTGLPVPPDKNSAASLKIPGCYYAFKLSHEHWIGVDRNLEAGYVLAFGNWGTAKPSHEYGDLRFHFIHPNGSPFVENMVIILMGNEQRIKEQLSQIDWTKINEGLTL